MRSYFKGRGLASEGSLVSRCCYGGLILAMSIVLSLISEFHHGVLGFGFRFLDCVIVIMMIPIIGFPIALAVGIFMPPIHSLIDSDHPPYEILYWIISNSIAIIITYFAYFRFKMRFAQIKNQSFKFKVTDRKLEICWIFFLFLIIYFLQILVFAGLVSIYGGSYLVHGSNAATKNIFASGTIFLIVGVPFAIKYGISMAVFFYISPRLASMLVH